MDDSPSQVVEQSTTFHFVGHAARAGFPSPRVPNLKDRSPDDLQTFIRGQQIFEDGNVGNLEGKHFPPFGAEVEEAVAQTEVEEPVLPASKACRNVLGRRLDGLGLLRLLGCLPEDSYDFDPLGSGLRSRFDHGYAHVTERYRPEFGPAGSHVQRIQVTRIVGELPDGIFHGLLEVRALRDERGLERENLA